MKSNHTAYPGNIRIANRSDAIEVFGEVMKSIIANGDMGGYVESVCGEGFVIDCLYAIKDALERNVI